MEDRIQELKRQVSEFIGAGVKEQWLFLREVWEPKLLAEFAGMVAGCTKEMEKLLVETAASPASPVINLVRQGRFLTACERAVR